MKNMKSVEVTKEIDIVQSVTCNKCGNTYEEDDEGEYMHIHHIDTRFDGERNFYRYQCWLFDLCDNCLADLVKTFKYAPDWFMGSTGKDAQKLFDKWVKDGCKPRDRFY